MYLVCKFSECADIASVHYLALVWESSQMKSLLNEILLDLCDVLNRRLAISLESFSFLI